MRTIAPAKLTAIEYQLPQPYDTATYYVRCIIYDLLLNSIVATLDLTDLGAQRFRYNNWLSPVDNSGVGKELVARFFVYEDSGHTTLSANYGIKEEYWTIIEPYSRNTTSLGGGVGGAIDYRLIRDTVEKVLIEEIKKIPQTDFSEINKRIKGVEDGLKEISSDNTYLSNQIVSLKKDIGDMKSDHTKGSGDMMKMMDEKLGTFSDKILEEVDKVNKKAIETKQILNAIQRSEETSFLLINSAKNAIIKKIEGGEEGNARPLTKLITKPANV